MRAHRLVTPFSVFILAACSNVAISVTAQATLPITAPATPTSMPKASSTPFSSCSISQPSEKEIFALCNPGSPTPTFIPAPATRTQADKISGEYDLNDVNFKRCRLDVLFEPNLPQNDVSFDQIDFIINCYNLYRPWDSGMGKAKIVLRNNIAVYTPLFFLPVQTICNVIFQFQPNDVIVTQLGEGLDCGFGHRVDASGVYKIVNTKPPSLDCDFLYYEKFCETPTPSP
jgi:hypothetical protein